MDIEKILLRATSCSDALELLGYKENQSLQRYELTEDHTLVDTIDFAVIPGHTPRSLVTLAQKRIAARPAKPKKDLSYSLIGDFTVNVPAWAHEVKLCTLPAGRHTIVLTADQPLTFEIEMKVDLSYLPERRKLTSGLMVLPKGDDLTILDLDCRWATLDLYLVLDRPSSVEATVTLKVCDGRRSNP